MSTRNINQKKKPEYLKKENLIVIGIGALVVIVFSIILALAMPSDKTDKSFENEAKQSSVNTTNENVVEKHMAKEEGEKKEEAPKEKENNVAEVPKVPDKISFSYPVKGKIVKDFSGDELVFFETLKDWRTHNGVDISASEGTEVLAAADGTVEKISDKGMYGKTIVILHRDNISTVYSNLNDEVDVEEGNNVLSGTKIGKVGNSATAEALDEPHLHFEVCKNEEYLDPKDYLCE